MRYILIDTETSAWYNARGVADLVVLSYSEEGEEPRLVTDAAEAAALWLSWVDDPNVTIIAHNAAFDMAVMAQAASAPGTEPGTGPAYEKAFRAYAQGRVQCTEVRQRLCEMYQAKPDDRGYSLGAIMQRLFAVDLSSDKKAPTEARALLTLGIDSRHWPQHIREATPWRFRYGELAGVPLDLWPYDARRYAAEDVEHEWQVWRWQEDFAKYQRRTMGLDPIADQSIEAFAAWDLFLIRTPGFHIDRERTRRLIRTYHGVELACAEILATHCAFCSEPLAPAVGMESGADAIAAKVLESAEWPVTLFLRGKGKRRGKTPHNCRVYVDSQPATDAAQRPALVRVVPPYQGSDFVALPGGPLDSSKDHYTIAGIEEMCPNCNERALLINRTVVNAGLPAQRVDETKSDAIARRLVYNTLGKDGAELTKGAAERGESLTAKSCKCDAKAMMRVVAAKGGRHITTDDGVHAYQAKGAEGVAEYLRELDVKGGTLGANARRLLNKAQKARTSFLLQFVPDDALAIVADLLGISVEECERRYMQGDWLVRTSYQVVVSTGRTASRSPSVQNLPARTVKDPEITIRGCIIPPPGWLFIDSDYGQLELCHFAQTLTDMRRQSTDKRYVGAGDPTYVSSLARAINEGKDGHIIIAAQLLGLTYEEAKARHAAGDKEVAAMRQLAKVANYGFPGGMGPRKFIEFAAAQGVTVTLKQAYKLREVFLATWHEAQEYFEIMGALCEAGGGEACAQISRTELIRGRVPYCAACNLQFQGPAARGCKRAMRLLIDACYRDDSSPLFGARPLAFIHDEFLSRVRVDFALPERFGMVISGSEGAWALAPASPDCRFELLDSKGEPLYKSKARENLAVMPALLEQNRLMEIAMATMLPDVKCFAEGVVQARWGKG